MSSENPILVCFAVREEARAFLSNKPPHVQVLVTGMGAVNATRALERHLTASTPGMVLTCGFAGGLNPDLSAGDVLFDADPDFPFASLLAARARPARFHCAGRVASSVSEKRELARLTGADAVEMESGIIRRHCRQRGIPSATLRVVSDAWNEPLPLDFNKFLTPNMKLRGFKLAAHIASHPGLIPQLLRLQRITTNSGKKIARVLLEIMPPAPASKPL